MSDSNAQLDALSIGQQNIPTRINELVDALSPTSIFGRRGQETTGFTWGYYGGRWGGVVVPSATLGLVPSTTNYVVVNRGTLVVSSSDSITNWDDVGNYARLYLITTSGAGVTAYEDHRAGQNGVFNSGSGGGMTNPMTTAGDIIVGTTGGVPVRLAAGADNRILTIVAGVPQWVENTGGVIPTVAIPVAVGDETTDHTTGTAKVTFRMPFAFTLSAVRASLTTAPTGSSLVVDINEDGVSILSTKLSIDATEKTSVTAATPAVISDSALADDAEITIDIDQIGSTVAGAGLKVYLIGTRT
jgi:hypothetical protein